MAVRESETGKTRHVRYEEYRQACAEHDRFNEPLDALMSHPLGKFSAIANSVKDLPVQQQFWAKEHESVKSDFNKTPRGKGREALNEVKKMLRFDERTDSWVHNWIGHDGVPSKVLEWHPAFRVDNLQLTQLELPKAPGFDQTSAGDQAAHMKDMAGLFDLAALSAMSHPDIISKELKPGCTADETVYEGVAFEGTLKFYPDGTMRNKNTNFDEEQNNYYYYKDGYVFALMAETDAEYDAEIASINENFHEAVASPFYAAKINAFRQVAVGLDDYVTTYTCTGAIVFAVAGGVVALALIVLTVSSFVLCKKAKDKE